MKTVGPGMGHGVPALLFLLFQTQDIHYKSIMALLSPTKLMPGFRNLNTVLCDAATHQMGLEIKFICNV